MKIGDLVKVSTPRALNERGVRMVIDTEAAWPESPLEETQRVFTLEPNGACGEWFDYQLEVVSEKKTI
jgi:hypothetical protein